MMMSLDGYMAAPGGEMDWFVTDDEFGQYVLEMGKTRPFHSGNALLYYEPAAAGRR